MIVPLILFGMILAGAAKWAKHETTKYQKRKRKYLLEFNEEHLDFDPEFTMIGPEEAQSYGWVVPTARVVKTKKKPKKR